MVTFVKSEMIRSSMSRKDNVHPQQPHKTDHRHLDLALAGRRQRRIRWCCGHFVRRDFVAHDAPESSDGSSARSRTDSISYLRRPIGTS